MSEPARVLVVDDDKQVRVALSKVFSRAGYESVPASSAEEAIALLDGDDFDLVVADIVLGGMDGVELLQQIREKRLDVPVVLVTAYSKEEYERQAQANGAYAYLCKPVSRQEILKTAQDAIAARR